MHCLSNLRITLIFLQYSDHSNTDQTSHHIQTLSQPSSFKIFCLIHHCFGTPSRTCFLWLVRLDKASWWIPSSEFARPEIIKDSTKHRLAIGIEYDFILWSLKQKTLNLIEYLLSLLLHYDTLHIIVVLIKIIINFWLADNCTCKHIDPQAQEFFILKNGSKKK